jgi:hypothetical protein
MAVWGLDGQAQGTVPTGGASPSPYLNCIGGHPKLPEEGLRS